MIALAMAGANIRIKRQIFHQGETHPLLESDHHSSNSAMVNTGLPIALRRYLLTERANWVIAQSPGAAGSRSGVSTNLTEMRIVESCLRAWPTADR